MKIAISQSNYIPWKGYFDTINRVDHFVLYDEVQYTRRDWRSRNYIKSPNGLLMLSIPVEVKGRFDQKISEARIAGTEWAAQHWESIRRNYRRAENFGGVSEFLGGLYYDASGLQSLSALNQLFIESICRVLCITTPISQSVEFRLEEERNDRLISVCRQLGADTYLSGPAAKAYLDEQKFLENGIVVEWMNYSNYPAYPQLYGPFEHGVSIIDLLLNVRDPVRFFHSF